MTQQPDDLAVAVKRARQIAAKMNNDGHEQLAANPGESLNIRKRALEDEKEVPVTKRIADSIDTPPTPDKDPKEIAKNALTRLGWSSDNFKYETDIPSRYVGLVIGKGGETIAKLQHESQATVQVAPDPPDGLTQQSRHVTITGKQECVEIAKQLIKKIIDNANIDTETIQGIGRSEIEEMMIPAGKVGLVIGKGGEMIKSLQEQAGCKMQMIQDGAYQGALSKPLRLQGNYASIEKAKQLVKELLEQKEAEARGLTGDFSGPVQTIEIQVPRDLVGVIIGRNGEKIKQIQTQSGARLQFQNDTNGSPFRIATLTGPGDTVQKGQHMVQEVMNDVMAKQGKTVGVPSPSGAGFTSVQIPVAAGKCGLVIGKGGEKIRELQRQCGAHIEINKATQNNPHERLFNVRGTQVQVNLAQVLIRQVVENSPGISGTSNVNNNPAPVQPYPQLAAYPQTPHTSAVYPPYQITPQPAATPWTSYPFPYPTHQNLPGQPTSANPTTAGVTQQVKDQHTMWAAYYQQYYAAAAAAAVAQQSQVQVLQNQATQQSTNAQNLAGSQSSSNQIQNTGVSSATTDLQSQWADYFRQLGYQYPYAGQTNGQSNKDKH